MFLPQAPSVKSTGIPKLTKAANMNPAGWHFGLVARQPRVFQAPQAGVLS
jgi:hypothetical protein